MLLSNPAEKPTDGLSNSRVEHKPDVAVSVAFSAPAPCLRASCRSSGIRLMAHNGLVFTGTALGLIFLWFGIGKFLPTVTPIDQLAERTLAMVTFHWFRPENCLRVLAAFECVIGILLLPGRLLRLALALLFLQMPGTFLP